MPREDRGRLIGQYAVSAQGVSLERQVQKQHAESQKS